ncbi:L-arabinose 1-dehydrogenase [Tsuneonella dongtanensis]|uniref:L-arabinose 1-dehydrogenase n=1 Tax=Tsuneonella dongtanensis TaxID=692370 RepID=A0A1B2AB32_9SPHN|nr:Gfo/Idh/MocA family oxidoreductase [Tsuneonella dongtanensis]ANY19288.1 L-arabinose 1-dehydrogenase [Tsuneonella dongtanensis]
MTGPIRIALVGFGKIARDQHVAAIAATEGIELVAVCSEHGAAPEGIPQFASLDAMAASGIAVDATSHCNTPAARFATARRSLELGYATLLEKPPFATLSQCREIEELAEARGLVLATSWHSQHNAAVDAAKAWLADKTIRRFRLAWIESARKWHPGQEWIWQAGGFGVFDPGINGFSVMTKIMPFPVHVAAARFEVPGNYPMPIAAELDIAAPVDGFDGKAVLDFRGGDSEQWDIAVECDEGTLELFSGGRRLLIDGETRADHGNAEYRGIYADFVAAVRAGTSAVDLAPLRFVADAFMLAERTTVEDYQP